MKVGDLVWTNSYGILRFGTITSKRIGDHMWAFFKVQWHDDHLYEKIINNKDNLLDSDSISDEYRADQIKKVSTEHLKNVLQEYNL